MSHIYPLQVIQRGQVGRIDNVYGDRHLLIYRHSTLMVVAFHATSNDERQSDLQTSVSLGYDLYFWSVNKWGVP